jgi:MFS family permease
VHSKNLPRSLAVLFAVNILNFYDRQVLGALLEPIRKEFHLSDTQLGALGTLPIVLYALAGLPLGRLADSGSRKRLLAAGVAVWASLTGLGGLVQSYLMLMVSRLGRVCGRSRLRAGGYQLDRRSVSGRVALARAGYLHARRAYRRRAELRHQRTRGAGLGLAGGPGGGGAARACCSYPRCASLDEPVRGASEERHLATSTAPPVWSILRIPTMWWIIASGALVNFNLYALATFFPAFLTRYHGLSVGQAGLWAGVGYAVAGIAGGAIAGAWGDRVIHKRKDGRMLSAAVAALVAAPLALIGIRQPAGGAAASIALIMIAYGFLNMYYGLGVLGDSRHRGARGPRATAMSIYFLAMYLCGASFGPLITGRLSDYLARSAAHARWPGGGRRSVPGDRAAPGDVRNPGAVGSAGTGAVCRIAHHCGRHGRHALPA